MEYIIGVDGGGTKTEAVAYDLNDLEIGRGLAGSGNLNVDFELAFGNIKEAISQSFQRVNTQWPDGKCLCIYLGIAGIEVGDNVEKIQKGISAAFQCKAIGIHDSQLAHASLLKGKDGLLTIAGTGSVCFGRYQGRTGRTGGWGHLLGDQGSGYWIGLETVKRMISDYDSGRPASDLSQAILTSLGMKDANDIKDYIYSTGYQSVAGITPVVAERANRGDLPSIDILEHAGVELALMTVRLYQKLEMKPPGPIAISGSVLCKVDRTRQKFQSTLEQNLGPVQIITEDISPTKGACYLYRNAEAQK
jgi:N-acetylglucosamine kinase-like BadF-type ATPase